MRKFYANINTLAKKGCRCYTVVKCILLKSFCSNMYCFTMYYNCTVTDIRTQNFELRIVFNIISEDCNKMVIVTIIRIVVINETNTKKTYRIGNKKML